APAGAGGLFRPGTSRDQKLRHAPSEQRRGRVATNPRGAEEEPQQPSADRRRTGYQPHGPVQETAQVRADRDHATGCPQAEKQAGRLSEAAGLEKKVQETASTLPIMTIARVALPIKLGLRYRA